MSPAASSTQAPVLVLARTIQEVVCHCGAKVTVGRSFANSLITLDGHALQPTSTWIYLGGEVCAFAERQRHRCGGGR